ncbi:MAG: helix-turn-helix domain-containing protein [Sutterella wadsworthensis]
MIRAIRVRLYPTPDQKKYLAGLFGAVRFCFNKALYLILQRRLPMQDGVNSCASANTRRSMKAGSLQRSAPSFRLRRRVPPAVTSSRN